MRTILFSMAISTISLSMQAQNPVGSTAAKKGDITLPTSAADLQSLALGAKSVATKYSVEDFFKNPTQASFSISPDGKYLSYTSPYNDRMNLFVKELSTKKIIQLTFEEDRDLGGYFWASNDRIVYLKDSNGDENFQLFAIDKDGKNQKDLTPYEKVTVEIIDDLEDSDDELIIGLNKDNPMMHEPYRLNIKTGELTKLAENTNPEEIISGWMTDHAGKLRIATRTIGTDNVVMYRDNENEKFTDVIRYNYKEGSYPSFFDFDNGAIVYAESNVSRDKSVAIKMDMKTGKQVGEVLFEHPQVDIGSINYSKKRNVLTSFSYYTDKPGRKFVDKISEERFAKIKQLLGDKYEVAITDFDKEEKIFLVRTYSDRLLGAYYIYNASSNSIEKLLELSPWFKEEDLCEMKPIEYTSRDGKTIHGYLTLPKGKDAKNLPVIINPHGGPWARDKWGFNPEVQLLAHNGYAVLQINFRGSTGYGRSFMEASFKQWGQTMQNDITDGVDWLIKKGIADSKKVAIYGGSYGGYATLAGVTYTPNKYACAIDYVGVSNLLTFMSTIPPYWESFRKQMYDMVGNPEDPKDKAMLEAYSPALNVDKIKTPLFVIQGAQDPRVNIDEADQIVKNLRKRGVDVPYLVKYNEGHGFHNQENKYEAYQLMLGFFHKYLIKK